MLSRVAERMYWAGRYLERVESTARLVSVHSNLLLDLPVASGINWEQLLTITEARSTFDDRYAIADETNILNFLLASEDNSSSLLSSLTYARENIRTSRDIVPSEAWECINELYLLVKKDVRRAVQRRNRFESLSEYIVRCQLLTGLLFGTMSHGDAYHFLRVGAYIERADMTARVVDVAAATLAQPNAAADDDSAQSAAERLAPFENSLWMSVLKSVSGYQMYRQYVRRRVDGEDVVRFLLGDAQFPHAVNCTLRELATHIARLPSNAAPNAVIATLQQQLRTYTDAPKMGQALHEFIDTVERGLNELHNSLEDAWFLKPETTKP